MHPSIKIVVEVICDGTESDELIESYLRRGLSPVKIEQVQDAPIELPVLQEAQQ